MNYCSGCRYLYIEKVPQGYAAHCMDPEKPEWLGRKRTIQFNRVETGIIGPRPVWCKGIKK